MTTWLVILLLAVMLSPLAWLMPSNRQRGKMALRLEARRLGLAMQLARQDWPHWLELSADVLRAVPLPAPTRPGGLVLLAEYPGPVAEPVARGVRGR